VKLTGQWGKLRSMTTTTAGVAALAFCGSVALAQSKPAASNPAPKTTEETAKPVPSSAARAGADTATKIAAVNLRVAIATTAEGKQAAAQLEAQFAERRKELEDLNKKISDLQQKLNAGSTVISDEEKAKIQVEGQKLTRQLDRRQQDFQEDLSEAQNEVVSRIGQRVVQVIGKYAPSNGYAAVLDNSAQATPVMYAATDITQDIVKLYDQTYPAKASAAPAAEAKPGAKPAAPKPSGQ
jgi:outer membrane protein